jgi:hypothetical protein
MLLGKMTVVEQKSTVYTGANGKDLAVAGLHKGDKVVVTGYKVAGELLSISIRDTSHL